MLLCFSYGVFQLKDAEPVDNSTNAETLKVALIPGNISQLHKWDTRQFPTILQRYMNLTYKASKEKLDLIVWPETAIWSQALTGEWPTYYGRFAQMLRNTATPILIGTANKGETDKAIGAFSENVKKSEEIYNRVLSISPDGKIHESYAKMHLVPFGEYVPLEHLIPDFIPNFIQFKPFTPGKTVNLLPVFNVKDKTEIVSNGLGPPYREAVSTAKEKTDPKKQTLVFQSALSQCFRTNSADLSKKVPGSWGSSQMTLGSKGLLSQNYTCRWHLSARSRIGSQYSGVQTVDLHA